ncbi:MAG: RNA polymerase sporulation sigma factor SigK [Clostridia bacterium]|nr:RNA polymerase sporulation sigma factor SigK [Clostridia bacterium]
MIGSALVPLLFGALYLILKVSDGQSFPPPLSSEEERRCFRLARAGDSGARALLIEHNMRLVVHIVKKYYTQTDCQEDLISIGTIGLIKAIDTFDVDKGARFATYAGRCVQNEILMYFRSQKKLVGEVSMNETIDVDKDGNPLTYADILATEDHIAEELFTKISSRRAVDYIMKELESRERQILILRYGLDGGIPLTQREISKKLGISRSYVSRLEKGALEKIGSHLRLLGC